MAKEQPKKEQKPVEINNGIVSLTIKFHEMVSDEGKDRIVARIQNILTESLKGTIE